MHGIKFTLLFVIIIGSVVGCGKQESNGIPSSINNITEQNKVAITEAIKERVSGYADAVKRRDADWLLNFWSNEKDFAMAGDGELTGDYESGIAKPTRDFISGIKSVLHFKFSDGHTYVINENAVSYATNFDWGIVLWSGDTVKSKGSWLYLFRKSDNGWKVVHSAGTHKNYK